MARRMDSFFEHARIMCLAIRLRACFIVDFGTGYVYTHRVEARSTTAVKQDFAATAEIRRAFERDR